MAEPAESDSAPRGDTRRRWRLVLAAVAVAATLGVVAIVFARRPEPFRVLIAVDVGGQPWTGSRPAVVIAEQLSARLVQFGFEPVDLSVAENRKRLGQADSLTAAAKKLRASFVVSAHLEPSLELYALSGGHAEARVKGPIELAYRGEPPIQVGRVAAFSGAPLKERALEQLGEQLADRVFDVVLPALMDHESIQKRVTGGDAAIKARFSRATGYVTRRRTRLDQARRAYQSLGEKRLAEERGPVKPTYHGSLDRSIGLSGTGAKGALLKSSEAPPFFMPDTSELVPLSELERLFWLTPDGTERDVFSGYHIAGYASVAPAGSPIVLMEDISGWAKALVTIDASGQATRLRIEPVRVLADPKIAPDGRAVALWDRPCRGCPGGVLVLALPNGRELMRTDRTHGVARRLQLARTESARAARTPGLETPGARGEKGSEGCAWQNRERNDQRPASSTADRRRFFHQPRRARDALHDGRRVVDRAGR